MPLELFTFIVTFIAGSCKKVMRRLRSSNPHNCYVPRVKHSDIILKLY